MGKEDIANVCVIAAGLLMGQAHHQPAEVVCNVVRHAICVYKEVLKQAEAEKPPAPAPPEEVKPQ